MIVRIRFRHGPQVRRKVRKNTHLALALAALLTPAALTACALSLWRLAAELGMAGRFAIAEGLFSHWQVWLGIAAMVQGAAILLNRYGRGRALLRLTREKPGGELLNLEG